MKKNKIKIISNESETINDNETLYVTFSKTLFLKYKNENNVIYFFDIPFDIEERLFVENLECSLLEESRTDNKKWFFLSYKFIYKYLMTYNQFYNRFDKIISNYSYVKSVEISSSISFILKLCIQNITKKYNIKLIFNNNNFRNFSYRHSKFMGADMPKDEDIDNTNIFLYIYGFYLRLKKHKVFVFPSSFIEKLPNGSNLFKQSIFNVIAKVQRYLGIGTDKNYLRYFPLIDFSIDVDKKYQLNPYLWKSQRDDQLEIIENIINIFFEKYSFIYIEKLKNKLDLYLTITNTKKIIIDETYDSFRKLICVVAQEKGIKTEYMPHGMIDEDLQFPLSESQSYRNIVNPKVLAWNNNSSKYLHSKNIESTAISYPISIYPHKNYPKKDCLIMLTYGDRVNLNAFEDDIVTLLPLITQYQYSVDMKIRHNIFEESNQNMKYQKEMIEKEFNTKIPFISHDIKSSSIIKNYKVIIFTTWTTGIFEAALLNTPFIIFTKEKEKIHAFSDINLPIASSFNHLNELMKIKDMSYLSEIRKSLTENISLTSHLETTV